MKQEKPLHNYIEKQLSAPAFASQKERHFQKKVILAEVRREWSRRPVDSPNSILRWAIGFAITASFTLSIILTQPDFNFGQEPIEIESRSLSFPDTEDFVPTLIATDLSSGYETIYEEISDLGEFIQERFDFVEGLIETAEDSTSS